MLLLLLQVCLTAGLALTWIHSWQKCGFDTTCGTLLILTFVALMFCQSPTLPPSPIYVCNPPGWGSASFSCKATWRQHLERSTGCGWTSSRRAPTATGAERRGAAGDRPHSHQPPLLLSPSDHPLRRETDSISYYCNIPAFRQLHKHSSEVSFICDIFGREADSFYLLKIVQSSRCCAGPYVTVIPVYIKVCCWKCSQLLRKIKNAVL